jgi:beta-galactosidase GanA
MNLNTVLAAISWAQLEPSEGKFDYTLVDGLIRDARTSGLRLFCSGSAAGRTLISLRAPSVSFKQRWETVTFQCACFRNFQFCVDGRR